MNIYRPKYKIIKSQLKIFGEKVNCKTADPRVKYSAAFWEKVYENESGEEKYSWGSVLSAYIYFCCTSSERKFIDLQFFEEHKTVFVSLNFHLSERACQIWKDDILKNLAGLAIQAGLLRLDVKKQVEGADAETCAATDRREDRVLFVTACPAVSSALTDFDWQSVQSLLPQRVPFGRPRTDGRKAIEAMVLIFHTQMPWRKLPKKYGPWKTIYNNFLLLKKLGIWDKIAEKLQLNDRR